MADDVSYHEYESPRGESAPDKPCAVCGADRNALIHSVG
jgi:hypothetical protein